MSTTDVSPDLLAQRDYEARVAASGFDYGVTVGDAFVRGMRDMGYRTTARALDELIDNSIQAEARNVLIAFGFTGNSTKPTALAVIDDGHGMDPGMVRLSAIWGGTHRENDRTGFGRYGYGLPSACVSQGERFTVYSQVDGGEMHAVELDLEEIRTGKREVHEQIVMPPAEPRPLPGWVREHIREHLGVDALPHGTVVVIDKLDRLYRKTAAALEPHLLQSTAVTYRWFLQDVSVCVNGKKVEPIDPLFTTPGFRFYDLDEDRAEPLEPAVFDVKDESRRRVLGTVRVRYSSMPATFAREDKLGLRGRNNARFNIIDENNGLIIMRQSRQIAVVTRGRYLKVNNDDRYWGCEINIPATLDEEIAITTSKQQVELSERMWELLKDHGVFLTIRELRRRYDQSTANLKTKREEADHRQRTSEQAMAAADKFKTRKAADTPQRRERARATLEEEVRRRAERSGVDASTIRAQLETETQERRYRVERESLRGAPFFRVDQVGTQKVLYLNTEHRFYTLVYAGPESTPRLRAALEVLLFVLGTNQLESDGLRREFYDVEVGQWSQQLHAVLGELETIDSARDAALSESDAAEREEMEAGLGI